MSASPARRTVAFVNNSRETFTPTVSGAIATCVLEVGRVALAEGFDCPVITRPADAAPHDWPDLRLLDPIRQHGATSAKALRARRRLNGWARPDQWVFAREALAELEQLRPRAVVVNNDPEVAVFLSRKLPGVRIVHWFHNLEMSSDRFRRRFAADRGIRSVAVSGYLARAVEQVYQLTPLTVTAALNGVAADRFGTERTSPLVTVGYLGRLAVEKAPDTLVAACIRVAERGTRFRLQLVGDTNFGFSGRNPFIDGVSALVAELEGLGIEVVRTGHLERAGIPGALAGSDIHVTPSRWDEPCGLTTLEGLASGQAVVGSATGGTPELLDGAGLLFPRDDIDALADVLDGLIRDPGARASWGARARARAESLTWERTWDGLVRAAGLRADGGN
ncbi:glycosyltransferase family 4 protein [Agromyces sp. NPDC057865]|uniref:glycosyltransferase family 4 protein n=1 Tax=Agromyces sp. NPDC057865 TaxID=3346267 RepID=UPI00366EE8A0